MPKTLSDYIRILLGLVYLLNGTNWFFKIITPYPSMSDFVDYLPPPDIVGAMIENGMMFHLAKAIEVVTGLALLSNRLVPLALVVAMTVTVPVFLVDVFSHSFRVRAFLMGSGSLVLNCTLLAAFYHHYRPMMAWQAQPQADPAVAHAAEGGAIADSFGHVLRLAFKPLQWLSALMGTVMVVWLLVMVAQYAADPKAIGEVREMTRRPSH